MKMREKILLIALVPLLVFGIVIIILCSRRIEAALTKNIGNGLRGTAIAVRTTFRKLNDEPYMLNENNELLKGDFNISQTVDLSDEIKENANIDVTIFYGDTRYMTSVRGEDGERILGTKAGPRAIEVTLGRGEELFVTDAVVADQEYFGYYVPLFDFQTGETVGMVFAGIPRAEAKAEIRSIIILIAVVTIILMVICFLLILYNVGKMSKRLKAGVDSVLLVSQGRLNIDIDPKMLANKDETGDISRAIQKLQTNLAGIVSGVIRESKDLLDASNQMRERTSVTSDHVSQMEKAVNEIAIGAGSQAEETQNATENIILMGNMIEEMSEELDNLTQKAQLMKERGETVIEAIRELQESNAQTSESINIIYEQTNVTNESAQKIKEATALITNIAEETNLLSLNASIEAARAGEQGRGFAVVAAQIQKLAEQSNESAMQIERIILSLIEDSDKSVATMNEVKEMMEQQSQNVTNTDAQVASLIDEVEQSLGVIDEVSAKTSRINEARGHVVDTVQNLSAIAQENAASTEETSASVTEISGIIDEIADEAHELKGISDQMNESMSVFQL